MENNYYSLKPKIKTVNEIWAIYYPTLSNFWGIFEKPLNASCVKLLYVYGLAQILIDKSDVWLKGISSIT